MHSDEEFNWWEAIIFWLIAIPFAIVYSIGEALRERDDERQRKKH